jgi:hypothetical protein
MGYEPSAPQYRRLLCVSVIRILALKHDPSACVCKPDTGIKILLELCPPNDSERRQTNPRLRENLVPPPKINLIAVEVGVCSGHGAELLDPSNQRRIPVKGPKSLLIDLT